MNKIYFPLTIATGDNFCNREVIRAQIQSNIEQVQPTLLSAPRRYGKTSLVEQVLQYDIPKSRLKNHFSHSIELLMAHDLESVQSIILSGIGRLAGDILPFHKSAMIKLQSYFSAMRPEYTMDIKGPRVALSPKVSLQSITEGLMRLDQMAQKENVTVTLAMDEFQQIATIKQHAEIEAAIRAAVQRSTRVSYIFTGSNRHLLDIMFENASRPFFGQCERITLERISEDKYRPFILAAANNRWGNDIGANALHAILKLTRCHPYYINALCHRLWRHAEAVNAVDVESEWDYLVRQESDNISSQVGKLAASQRAVMIALAEAPDANLTGKTFLQRARLAASSCAQAAKALKSADLIHQQKDGAWAILDPLMEATLINNCTQ